MEETKIKPEFSRDDTKALKGIAIILMLFHHLAAFSYRWPLEFTGFESLWSGFISGGYLEKLALNAKICVSIYFFLGGYGLYIRWKKGNFKLGSAIMTLYKTYWKVFAVFVPIAFIFFARSGDIYNTLCTMYTFSSGSELVTKIIGAFIGLSTELNYEWWFLSAYICSLFLGYLFCIFSKKTNSFWVDLFIVFLIDIFLRSVFPSILRIDAFASLTDNVFYRYLFTINPYASTFFAGIVFAKYDVIAAAKAAIKNVPLHLVGSVLLIGVVFWTRTYIIGDKADIILVALLVPSVSVLLDSLKPIKTAFRFLGQHSTNMWLIHSFYCYYFYEITRIVYCTKNVWIDLIILIALSLVSSILINTFYWATAKLAGAVKAKMLTRTLTHNR